MDFGSFEDFFAKHKNGRGIKNFRLLSEGETTKIEMVIVAEISNKYLVKLFGDYASQKGCNIAPGSFFSDWAQFGFKVNNCKKSFSVLITNDARSKSIIISCAPTLF